MDITIFIDGDLNLDFDCGRWFIGISNGSGEADQRSKYVSTCSLKHLKFSESQNIPCGRTLNCFLTYRGPRQPFLIRMEIIDSAVAPMNSGRLIQPPHFSVFV